MFIEVQAKQKTIEVVDGQETCEHTIAPRIYTEWLEIAIEEIKNKDVKTLESITIDFTDSGEMDEIEQLVWTEAPGALCVDKHETFEKVNIIFNYSGAGIFYVRLTSSTVSMSFDVAAAIPLEIELNAYDKRATRDDIVNYFESVFNKNDFECNWRYRDDDIFFTASVKE